MNRILQTFGLTALALTLALVGVTLAGDYKDKDHKKQKEDLAKIGEPAPMFSGTTADGRQIDLAQLIEQDKIVVLEWFNPDCPYVKKVYEKTTLMNDLAAQYGSENIAWVAINSSHYADADYNRKWAEKWNISHPIVVDQSGEIGKMYGAKTTPHMYVINSDGTLVYDGAIDDNPTPSPRDETTNYVQLALQQVMADEAVATPQTKPYGCSVKYAKK